MSKYYNEYVKTAKGAGYGTTFNKEFNTIQKLREVNNNLAPIIALTDAEIDNTAIEYYWPTNSKNKIVGKLPPNTYIMAFNFGIRYLKNHGYDEKDARPGYFSYSKNIQYYDLSEKGRFK